MNKIIIMRKPDSVKLEFFSPLSNEGKKDAVSMSLVICKEVLRSNVLILSSHALAAIQTAKEIMDRILCVQDVKFEASNVLYSDPGIHPSLEEIVSYVKEKKEKFESVVVITHIHSSTLMQSSLWTIFSRDKRFHDSLPLKLNNGEAIVLDFDKNEVRWL